jgi:FtsZ-binding cell division protein ZapB
MLRSETTANEELTEQIQKLENELHNQRTEKERLQKANKGLQEHIANHTNRI